MAELLASKCEPLRGLRKRDRHPLRLLPMGREREVMEEGALIDLIEEAIHTDGSLLTDGEVLDIIAELLEKREGGK